MASMHHPIKNGARGNGAKHARYVAGEGVYSERADVMYLEDGNLPEWAADATEFFAAADEYERGDYTRKLKTRDGVEFEKTIKGRAYKEMEVAIPREAADPVKWAKDFAQESLGNKHPYRLAIHDKEAKDGGRNVHMHLMFSTRTMDGHNRTKENFFKRAAAPYRDRKTKEMVQPDPSKGGAKKSTYWDSQVAVHQHRDRFEKHVQRVAPEFKLERSDAPEQKIGPKLSKAGPNYERQREERLENVSELREAKVQRRDIDAEIKREKEIEARLVQAKAAGETERRKATPNTLIDLGTDINAAKRAAQPRNRTDELFAQLESKLSDRAGHQKDRENPLADFLQQRQNKNDHPRPPVSTAADPKENRTMDTKHADTAKKQAIEQPQQADQQLEQAGQLKEQERPRSRTDDLFAKLEQQQQKRDDRDRDGSPDLDR